VGLRANVLVLVFAVRRASLARGRVRRGNLLVVFFFVLFVSSWSFFSFSWVRDDEFESAPLPLAWMEISAG